MAQIDLSIIIPHWHNVKDLQRLLASIPVDNRIQTLVIDDYSEEPCFEQVKKLANTYNFTLLKNTGTKSAGACRNIGLNHAKGKWLLFADSDDFFLETLKTEFYNYFNSDNNIVFFPPNGVFGDTLEPCNRGENHAKKIYNYLSSPSILGEWNLRLTWHCPWSKLYSTSFLKKNNIKFEEVVVSNDIMFSAISGSKAKKFALSETPIYCSTVRYGSLENSVTKKIVITRMEAALRHQLLCKKLGYKEYGNSALSHYYESRYLSLKDFLITTKAAKKLGVFKEFSIIIFINSIIRYLHRRFVDKNRRRYNFKKVD